MKQEKTKEKRAKKKDLELFLAVFFVVIGVFVLLVASIAVLRVFIDRVPSDTTVATAPQKPPMPPTPQNAIFTGGKLEKLPYVTDRTTTVPAEDAEGIIKSSYALLMDASSGEILFSKCGDVRFNPASMTKVMTLIVACEYLTEADLDRKLQLTQDVFDYLWTGTYKGASDSFVTSDDENNPYKYLNDFFLINDVLYAIGMESAADATYMICKEIAGSEEAFVALMNQKAAALGLKNTHFDNAIGHESEQNYTTASDMAAIMAYAMQCDKIVEILSEDTMRVYKGYWLDGDVEKSYNRYMHSSLFDTGGESSRYKAYRIYYDRNFTLTGATLVGGKTGTLGAGTPSDPWIFSLVSFAQKDGKTYIAITGETPTAAFVLRDAKKLYDGYIK